MFGLFPGLPHFLFFSCTQYNINMEVEERQIEVVVLNYQYVHTKHDSEFLAG